MRRRGVGFHTRAIAASHSRECFLSTNILTMKTTQTARKNHFAMEWRYHTAGAAFT
jgi:hypothetical protein